MTLRILSIVTLFVGLTSCTTSFELPETAQKKDTEAFGLEKNFIIAIAQADQSFPATLLVAKSGSGFVFSKRDTTGTSVCENFTGTPLCRKTDGTVLSKEEQEVLLRTTEKSLWRVLGRQRTLDAVATRNQARPKFTTADPSKLPEVLKQYFPSKAEEEVSYCATAKKEEEQEILCVWNDLFVLSQYMDTSDLPVSSSRALLSYKDITLSEKDLREIYTGLLK